jgi:1-aminocyclopropane-1-carboxylate deaminase/D-cysteine desulfhydrase-like pyridoxal-dependent ACC family enzyme
VVLVSLADFPRYPLLFGPSPIHPLERLTAHLGGAAIWAKREDCNSGLAYGGNKTRKLEYLVRTRWPRARTRWSRSAGCSPTTPARSPRSRPSWA